MIVVNQQVTLNNCLPAAWFKKGAPLLLTGKVTKVFKNGNFAVSVNELPNRSDDGKRTMHFSAEDIASSWIPVADSDAWKAADSALIAANRK